MFGNRRTHFFIALYVLVALSGSVLTFLPHEFELAGTRLGKVTPALVARTEALPAAALQTPVPRATALAKLSSQHLPDHSSNRRENPLPAQESKVSVSSPAGVIPQSVPEAPHTPGSVHIVKAGESLTSISYRYLPRTTFMTLGELEAAIRQANPSADGKMIHPGQEILIPGIEAEPIVEKPRPMAKGAEVRAIYLTGWTAGSERGISLIRRWKAAGGNAICFDIKDFDGLVTVAFDHPLAPRRSPLIRNLPKFVRFMHQQDLHVIARIALFRDEHIAKTYPALAVQSRRSGGPWRENGKQVWTDPSLREVQDYNLALARRAAAAGVDEIQFDYVRFPAEGDQKDAEFHFESENASPQTAGEESPAPEADPPPRWTRTRVISEFLKRAYAEIHHTGALLSVDVFGVMAWQRPVDLAHTGQQITDMARYCDVLSPMVYPSHFFGMDGYAHPGDAPEHFISESMARFREITAQSGVVIRPWLQAFAWRTPIYSPDYVVTQVSVANQNGGVGYLFWNANNDYSKPFAAMPALMAISRQRAIEKAEGKERAASEMPHVPDGASERPDEHFTTTTAPEREAKTNY